MRFHKPICHPITLPSTKQAGRINLPTFEMGNKMRLRTIMVAQNVRRIESLNSFSEEIIVTVVGAAILTAVGLVWRNLLSPR
jgi:hypothetical protein